jgi:hypothetical protein
MRRKLTIALLGALAALALGAPLASAAKRAPATLASDKAQPAAVTIPVEKVAQYDGPYKRRFQPRPRHWGGGGGMVRRPHAGRMISMREAVMMVRSRVPGRIANAGLRGRFAWFRVISRGRVLNVVVDRLTRRLIVRRAF